MSPLLVGAGVVWGTVVMVVYTSIRSLLVGLAKRKEIWWIGHAGAVLGLFVAFALILVPISFLDRTEYVSWFPSFVLGTIPWMPWTLRKSVRENWANRDESSPN